MNNIIASRTIQIKIIIRHIAFSIFTFLLALLVAFIISLVSLIFIVLVKSNISITSWLGILIVLVKSSISISSSFGSIFLSITGDASYRFFNSLEYIFKNLLNHLLFLSHQFPDILY